MEGPETAQVNEMPQAPGASASERSTIEFPYTDLDNAIAVAQGVHDVAGATCSAEQLAAHLGVEPSGGNFRLRITGAQTYDLINYERGGRVTLAELGRRIIDPAQERAARRDAFLAVPLYARVFQEFNGRPLPPPPALERAMVSYGVGSKVANKARQVFMRSAKQGNFFELSSDRLTEPPIRTGERRPPPEQEVEQKDKNRSGSGGGGEQPPKLHPLIQGLLLTLPNPPGPWAMQDRLNWLVMANSIFKMIYPSKDQADIEIKPGENR